MEGWTLHHQTKARGSHQAKLGDGMFIREILGRIRMAQATWGLGELNCKHMYRSCVMDPRSENACVVLAEGIQGRSPGKDGLESVSKIRLGKHG